MNLPYRLTIKNDHGKVFYRKRFAYLAQARAIAYHGKTVYLKALKKGDALKIIIERIEPDTEPELCFWSKSRKSRKH